MAELLPQPFGTGLAVLYLVLMFLTMFIVPGAICLALYVCLSSPFENKDSKTG